MLFRRKDKSLDYEPVSAPEPEVTSIAYETYTYTMDDFKNRLGLENLSPDVLTVHITWDKTVEVQMMSALRIVRAHLRVCLTVRKKTNTKGNEPLIRFMNRWFTTERERP